MSRIVYACLSSEETAGGIKMAFRHVEAVVACGREAVVLLAKPEHQPTWFEHAAPLAFGLEALRDDDLLVTPEDAFGITRTALRRGMRPVVFCQNQHYAHLGIGKLSAEEVAGLGGFIAPSRTVADWLAWRYPGARVSLIPAFADERIFKPDRKRPAVILVPRKREGEVAFMRDAFPVGYPQHAGIPWFGVQGAPETVLARGMATSTLFLALSRYEGLGMTPLEAMASGCIVAGFTGGGGREYATSENGFWAEEDDVMGAVHALGAAASLVAEGGPGLERMREAGAETARRWSRASFLQALEAYWTERLSSRP